MRIAEVACAHLIGDQPDYLSINVHGRIDIDLEASGLAQLKPCPVCFRASGASGYIEPNKLVPLEQTWDRSDLFQMRNYPTSAVFCTLKVVELARRERWTNFRFQPMDTIMRFSYAWPGIDYLGDQWPPAKWYPDHPAAGKSWSEWLEELKSDNSQRGYKATLALLESGSNVVPQLVALLACPDPISYRAAGVLSGLKHQGIAIPQEIEPQIKDLLKDG